MCLWLVGGGLWDDGQALSEQKNTPVSGGWLAWFGLGVSNTVVGISCFGISLERAGLISTSHVSLM